MEKKQYLYHYTTISTLALVLKNRTIRFNRLDLVDDIGESSKYGEFNLSRYLFVSCWTDSDEESIPLWSMYSKGMTGIMISLPIDPFNYKPIAPHPLLGGEVNGQLLSFLPIEQIITNEYLVNAACMFNKDTFIKKIEYVKDEKLAEIRKQAVQVNFDEEGKPWTKIAGPTKLAGFKSVKWDFQRETRYVLMIYPSPPLSLWKESVADWVDTFPKF